MTPQLSSLGKYQIIEELGKGGFATVFRARDPDLDREVALKVLDPLLTRDPVWVERFRQEAKAIARLKHPRIITIHEIGQSEGSLYIATEMVEGGSLADHIAAQGRLSWEETVQLVGEIAEALGYAHSQGVLHRDMKPANVLLDPGTGAILTDFGFARIVADHSLSVSMSGGVVGTPAYIAPEVWHGDKTTAQTDVYALGCILYEMVTGTALFTGATPPAVMLAHFQPPALPDGWPDDVPPDLAGVLEKALAREPEQRYATGGDVAEALLALNVDHLAEPYAELEQAVAGENWQRALALIADIKAADPDYRDVAALEQKALAGVEEEARKAKLVQLQNQAEQSLDGEEWQQALALVEKIKTLDPTDEDVVMMEQKALDGMEEETKRQEIAELKKKALQGLSVRYWKEALVVVDEIKAVDPDNEDAEALEQQALAGMEEDAKKQQAEQWQAAVETALVAGNLQAAELALMRWLQLWPENEVALNMITTIEKKRQEARSQKNEAESLTHPTTTGAANDLDETEAFKVRRDKIFPEAEKMTEDVVEHEKVAPVAQIVDFIHPAFVAKDLTNDLNIPEVVHIPEGKFLLGSDIDVDPDAFDDEKPQHEIYLNAFDIAKFPITVEAFNAFVNATGHCTTAEEKGGGIVWASGHKWKYTKGVDWRHPRWPGHKNESKINHPVTQVSWHDAVAYCLWLSEITGQNWRLPTEAEWNKSSRGTDGRIYPWGNREPDETLCNFDTNLKNTTPVGQYPAGASPYGVLDMSGNVWEWTSSLWGIEWKEPEFKYPYFHYDGRENMNAPHDVLRVLCGGSWASDAKFVRTAFRFRYLITNSFNAVGFRPIRT